jgi:hypothetical protein
MTVSASVPDAAGVYSSNAIDLLDYAVLNASGNNATYTFTLNLRGKALSEVPSEIILKPLQNHKRLNILRRKHFIFCSSSKCHRNCLFNPNRGRYHITQRARIYNQI